MRPNTAGLSKLGRQNQSIEPALETSAHVCIAPMIP
jgi:hypothetical protein